MRRVLFALVVLLACVQGFADTPDNRSKYIVILRDPSAYVPKGAPPVGKFNEPDFAGIGANVLEKHGRYRVVTLPPPAIAELLKNPAVETIQRVYTGAALPAPVTTTANSLHAETDSLHAKADATWDSGTYLYDGAGNIKSIGTKSYAYDSAGRLVKFADNGTTVEAYSYDSFGNLVEKVTGSVDQSIPVDTSTNRLQGVQYDLNGNVTLNGQEIYVFDPLNMMHRRETPAIHEHYIYTADDERIAVYDEAWWHLTVRDGATPIREWKTWDLTSYYIWDEDHMYRDGQLVAAERDAAQGGIRHFHLDHLGTPRLITNDRGYRIAQHDYYPFGVEQTDPAQEMTDYGYNRTEPMQFTGHQRDSGVNNVLAAGNADYLDYMHARYYGPSLGRFLSVDHVDEKANAKTPQRWNRYAYVTNNPVSKLDPNGQDEYVFTWQATKDSVGHTAIAVENRDAAGQLTGTVTVRDLWPGGEVGKNNLVVKADYGTTIMPNVNLNHYTNRMGRPADGIIAIHGDAKQDAAVSAALTKSANSHPNYVAPTWVCSTFAASGTAAAGLPATQKGNVTVWWGPINIAGASGVTTPVALQNSLANSGDPRVFVIKDLPNKDPNINIPVK